MISKRIIFLLLCPCVIIMLMISVVSSQRAPFNYKEMEILDDLPVRYDMEKYLSRLEKIVYFIDAHKTFVNFNLCFGLYIINVNLRNVVKLRGQLLSFQRQIRLEHLVKTNDEIIAYVAKSMELVMASLGPGAQHAKPPALYQYTNDTTSPIQAKKFSVELFKKIKFFSRKNLEALYLKWPNYVKNVGDFNGTLSPTPIESDNCLNLLAQNPVNYYNEIVHCQVPYYCIKLILNGNDYGYGMTHRLLFFVLAHHWRNCYVISVADDKELIENLCSKMYNEGEYIASHDFELADLIMEQITLCSFEGHVQFLRRSWIDELLDFQTNLGCFNTTRSADGSSYMPWQFVKFVENVQDSCEPHITSVGGTILASAVRFILENYY